MYVRKLTLQDTGLCVDAITQGRDDVPLNLVGDERDAGKEQSPKIREGVPRWFSG